MGSAMSTQNTIPSSLDAAALALANAARIIRTLQKQQTATQPENGLSFENLQTLFEACRPTTLAALAADMINGDFTNPNTEAVGDLANAALFEIAGPIEGAELLERERIATIGA